MRVKLLRIHHIIILLCLCCFSLITQADEAKSVFGLDAEHDAVLNVISVLFSSMESRDLDKSRVVLFAGGKYYGVNNGDTLTYRSFTDEEYLEGLASGKSLEQERLIKPEVKVSGNIASVWSDYQFFVDGKLSHCGIDIFNLIKTEEGWRLVSSVYTTEKGSPCQRFEKYGDWSDGQYIIR